MLFEEFEDQGEGGQTVAEGSDVAEVFEESPEEEVIEDSSQPSSEPQAPVQDPNNTVLQDIVRQNQQLIHGLAQGQQQPQQPIDPAKIRQALQFYEMDQDTFQKIFNDELEMGDRVGAFQSAMDGMSKHAATLAQVTAQRVQEQLMQQFQPALQMVETQKTEQFVSGVEGKYPALKGQRKLIDAAIQTLRSEGYQENDDNVARETVARRVEEMVKVANPNWSLAGAQQNQQNTQHQSASGFPQMGSGGSAGSQGATAKSGGGKKPAWSSVFG